LYRASHSSGSTQSHPWSSLKMAHMPRLVFCPMCRAALAGVPQDVAGTGRHDCPICLGENVAAPYRLDCGHVLCAACLIHLTSRMVLALQEQVVNQYMLIAERDIFELPGPRIALSNSDSMASYNDGRVHGRCKWNTVYGRDRMTAGVQQWRVWVRSARNEGASVCQMIIGVSSDSDLYETHFTASRNKGFGYIQMTGKKSCGPSGPHDSYADSYTDGDVVSVMLNLDSLELSFQKNGAACGVSHNVPGGTYRLAISMLCPGQVVMLL